MVMNRGAEKTTSSHQVHNTILNTDYKEEIFLHWYRVHLVIRRPRSVHHTIFLICLCTSGQTAAWHFSHLSMDSGRR
jgi:hypothetical protein